MLRVLSDCHMRFGQVFPPVRICSTVRRARSGGRRRKKGRKKSQATASRDASMCLAFLAFVVRYETKLPHGGIRTLPKSLPIAYVGSKVLMVEVRRAACLPSLGEAFWRG